MLGWHDFIGTHFAKIQDTTSQWIVSKTIKHNKNVLCLMVLLSDSKCLMVLLSDSKFFSYEDH